MHTPGVGKAVRQNVHAFDPYKAQMSLSVAKHCTTTNLWATDSTLYLPLTLSLANPLLPRDPSDHTRRKVHMQAKPGLLLSAGDSIRQVMLDDRSCLTLISEIVISLLWVSQGKQKPYLI